MAIECYHPLFAVDLAEACGHYDAIAGTLGNHFRANVRGMMRSVAERPESFARIGGDFRGALIDRFPYVIVFTVENDTPHIFGLRHAASDRSDWFNRAMPTGNG